jgi:hypothetical protein
MKTIFKKPNGDIIFEADCGQLFYGQLLITDTIVRLEQGHFRVTERLVDLVDKSITYLMKKSNSNEVYPSFSYW